MISRLQVIVDHSNADTLSTTLAQSASSIVCLSSPAVWCHFGSENAAVQLGKLLRAAGDSQSPIYRFPISFADRIDFLAELAASIHQVDLRQVPASEISDPQGQRAPQLPKRALAWLRQLNEVLSESRLYDAVTLLKQFDGSAFGAELGDLEARCSDAASLCARILGLEIELVHSASAFVTKEKTAELTEQLANEGFFRVVPQLPAVLKDLGTHANFEKRCELLSVLGPTATAFKREVSKDAYGQDTSRLFAIHVGFLYQAACHEMAMGRFNEAFGLVFKGFEWMILWEGLIDGNCYLYFDRLWDRDTNTQFTGTGAVLAAVEKSLNRRDPTIFEYLKYVTIRRNIARIGHGLRVHARTEITAHATRLRDFLKLTARKRGVGDYVERLEQGFVLEGFAAQMRMFYSAEVLKTYRVVFECPPSGPSQAHDASPSPAVVGMPPQPVAERRTTLKLPPRPS